MFFTDERPDSNPPRETWVICSPILEEKNVAHGAMVTLARALAAQGARVLRLDYEGHGDSDGESGASGLNEWATDVEDLVAETVDTGAERLTLMGCRAGALIAAQSAARLAPARFVAWCPVVTGADHIQDLLRLNLTTQMAVYKKVQQDRDALVALLSEGRTVNIVGWTMGRPLLESLTASFLGEALARLSCSVDLLDLTRKAGDPAPAGVAALASARVRVTGVQGLPFWIDGNYIDHQQAALVSATATLVGAVER